LSYAHAGRIKAKLRREITRLMKLAEAAENEPDPELDIPDEIRRREDLVAKIDEARAKIEEREALRHAQIKAKHAERLALRKEQQRNGKKPRGPRPKLPKLRVEPTAQINLTDEESRIMPSSDGFVQGYNAQAAVSIESQLIVYAHVTQATNDKQQLVPALEGLQALPESLGVLSDIVADAGYYSEANVVACEGVSVTPYLAMSRERHHSWLDAKLRKPNSVPAENASPADRMAYRLQTPDGHELYAQRKSTVETPLASSRAPSDSAHFCCVAAKKSRVSGSSFARRITSNACTASSRRAKKCKPRHKAEPERPASAFPARSTPSEGAISRLAAVVNSKCAAHSRKLTPYPDTFLVLLCH
jgi:hypothetical protein